MLGKQKLQLCIITIIIMISLFLPSKAQSRNIRAYLPSIGVGTVAHDVADSLKLSNIFGAMDLLGFGGGIKRLFFFDVVTGVMVYGDKGKFSQIVVPIGDPYAEPRRATSTVGGVYADLNLGISIPFASKMLAEIMVGKRYMFVNRGIQACVDCQVEDIPLKGGTNMTYRLGYKISQQSDGTKAYVHISYQRFFNGSHLQSTIKIGLFGMIR